MGSGSVAALDGDSAVEGVDTGDPTLFPNRANGAVFGEYATAAGVELFQCSGSVIDSPAGDVVLTAGHCVIDPRTGDVARSLVFVPGYREGARPFGTFAGEAWVTTPEWASTAGTAEPDESGDLAMLVLARGAASGASVEGTVGGLSIAFEGPREGTYTQWGYPGEAPYDGEILYSHTTPSAGVDPFYPAATAPVRIASDFTAGASGGPWTVGPTSAPTVVSLTDYAYEFDPGHVYGARFGPAARAVYEEAAAVAVAPVATGAGQPAPDDSTLVPAPAAPASPPAQTAATGTASPRAAKPGETDRFRVSVVHSRTGGLGKAALVVRIGRPGTLRLTGAALRPISLEADAPGSYRMTVIVRSGSAAARALRRAGTAAVGAWVRFTDADGVRRTWRLVHLVDPPHSHPSRQPTPRSEPR